MGTMDTEEMEAGEGNFEWKDSKSERRERNFKEGTQRLFDGNMCIYLYCNRLCRDENFA